VAADDTTRSRYAFPLQESWVLGLLHGGVDYRLLLGLRARDCKVLYRQFRQRRAGVVVNLTSSVTLKPLPLLSVYTASKAAVNAFTESLALELAPFNVRVRLVLPGRAPATRYGENARPLMAEQLTAGAGCSRSRRSLSSVE